MNAFYLVLAVVLAIGGYQLANNHQKNKGYIPWGLPAWAWAIFWALGLLIGAVLWIIATRTYKPPVQAAAYAPAGQVPAGQVVAGQVVSGQPAAATPHVAAGWYPDPSGAASQRYWDGAAWTEHTH